MPDAPLSPDAALPEERLLRLTAGCEAHRGFAGVLSSLRAGHGGTIGGVWAAARALVVGALARAKHVATQDDGGSPTPVVVVLPHAVEAEQLADDLELFSTDRVVVLPPPEQCLVMPEPGFEGANAAASDPTEAARLLAIKQLAVPQPDRPVVFVTSIQALSFPVPDPREIESCTRQLGQGGPLDPGELAEWLGARGWSLVDAIEKPGTFARRGGILDLFAPDWERPVRIELDGDQIDSLRTFDIVSQRSVAPLERIDLTALAGEVGHDRATRLTDVVPARSWWVLVEPLELAEEGRRLVRRLGERQVFDPEETMERIYRFPSVTLAGIAGASMEATAEMAVEGVERFTGALDRVKNEVESIGRDHEMWIISATESEETRLRELLGGCGPDQAGNLYFTRGRLSAGFRLVPEKIVLVSAAEVFRRTDAAANRLPKQRLARAIDTFLDLQEGDLVVHVAHGIGRYRGLKLLEKHGRTEEFLELEFAEATRIYVPASCIELVQKYIGGTKSAVKLAKIGGTLWTKQKATVEKAVSDMAADMLHLQARRAGRPGRSFPVDTPWQVAFEAAFPFEPTPDQVTAMEAIRTDLESAKPMDRLLCGDVGFGKTELAMRAAFKVAEAGGQVAVLVPTTILAEQHRRTFAARFAEYPFTIRALSRLSSTREERETLEGLAAGKVDIVIGTHRLAGSDVHFANLGLLVVDEEQRFGVDVKERLKALRSSVDVLTMTATPIPRTLHMSLLGIRDISNLTTPPANRLAVETRVSRFAEENIRHAIERELARDGQVFFVHNRIHDIRKVADRLARIVPEASIGIAHGRLSELELEAVMLDFVTGRTDILLATTIIESGLDIPRANTIFIDEADQYGLADLHQLRGRVGRSHHRGYCYLLIDEAAALSSTAARRLRAIQEFSSTGAGFSLAMRDLEIRGAGNLLGTQQSGHIAAVGYELYCRLLENAVRGLKALPPAEPPAVAVDLPGEAWLPREYIPEFRTKIDIYRRISRATADGQLDDIAAELADRFGPLPLEASRLIEFARLRVAAAELGIDSISRHPGLVVFGHHKPRGVERLRDACRRHGRSLRLVGAATAVLPVSPDVAASPDRLFQEVQTVLRAGVASTYKPPSRSVRA